MLALLLCTYSLWAQTPVTYNFTGSIETYTVPPGVTTLTIEARGAQGGDSPSSAVPAGLGAEMIGDFAVTPGQVLNILVGEQNTSGNGGGGGSFVVDA
ncbi:MAG: autotransporter, partial [Flavobacteriaceae bacterium]|nr:autotransporter [Flavobacteriaceae bacterium]